MKCGCDAGWSSPFIGYFGDVALWVTLVGLQVVSLHEFDEVRCKVGLWVMCVVLVVEPIVSF